MFYVKSNIKTHQSIREKVCIRQSWPTQSWDLVNKFFSFQRWPRAPYFGSVIHQSPTELRCPGGGGGQLDVAGDSVVYHFHSAAAVMIRVKGRDATTRMPLCLRKHRPFDVCCVFECGFDMMEAFSSGKAKKKRYFFTFLFHTLPFFSGLACNAIFLYSQQ